jgi:hypothetical protein
MSDTPMGERPTEAELRAAYEEELKRVRVEHILLQNISDLVNLGMLRTGLMEGAEAERDPEQVRLAIEAVRALLPLLEPAVPEQAAAIRQALSQLQLAYVRIGGGAAPEPAAAPGSESAAGGGSGTPPTEPASPQPPASTPGEAGPAQRSGRLWIPGQ